MRRSVIIFGCLLIATAAISQVGHTPYGTVEIGMVFDDPNGTEHELWVCTDGPWVELRIDGVSVWMDSRQAEAAAHYLGLAADAVTLPEDRRGRPSKWGG